MNNKYRVRWNVYDVEYTDNGNIPVYFPESASFRTLEETLSFITELETCDNIPANDIKLDIL